MAGEYEPKDSRNVTGNGAPQQSGIRSPGGADQQEGGARWGGDGQMNQQQGGQRQAGQQQTGGQQQAEGGRNQTQMGANDSGTPGQQSQFQADQRRDGQMGGGARGDSGVASRVREHMEVIGADGARVGTVDHVDGNRIKLTKADSGMGAHAGHHHYIPLSLVADIEGDRVRLSANGDVAYGMEEEE